MGGEGGELLAGGRVPQADESLFSGGAKRGAVRREGDLTDLVAIAVNQANGRGSVEVPDRHRAERIGHGERLAVGSERDRHQVRPVLKNARRQCDGRG